MEPKAQLPIILAAAIISATSGHGQTTSFDVNGTTAGSGVAEAGSYDWHGAFWADNSTGTAATGTKAWGNPGQNVGFVSTAAW